MFTKAAQMQNGHILCFTSHSIGVQLNLATTSVPAVLHYDLLFICAGEKNHGSTSVFLNRICGISSMLWISCMCSLGSSPAAAGGRGRGGTSCPGGPPEGRVTGTARYRSSRLRTLPHFVTSALPIRCTPPLLTHFAHATACLTNIPCPKPREGRREPGKGRRRRLWILPVAGGRSRGCERRCPGGWLQLQQHQSSEGPARAPAKHCTQRSQPASWPRWAGPPPSPSPAPEGPARLASRARPRRAG